MNEIIQSSEAIIEWWLAFSYRKDGDKIFPKKFTNNEKERESVGKFLDVNSSDRNAKSYRVLKDAIYNKGIIDKREILDDKDGHDALAYFSISYICSLFWLLEDLPVNIDNSTNDIFKQQFLKGIGRISEGLIEDNSRKVFKGVFDLYYGIKDLDKPKSIVTAERPKFNIEEIGKYQDKHSEFNQFLQNCLNATYQQFDVYRLFGPSNDNKKYLDIITDNIYHHLNNNDCNYIVGIERGGIPLASLVAYKFNLQCHILRTVPVLKVLPELPPNSRIALFDDVAITGATINQAKKHIQDAYNPAQVVPLAFVERNGANELDAKLINISRSKQINLYMKNLKITGKKTKTDNDADLRESLKTRCILNKQVKWHSEFTYTQDIFYKVCDWFIEEIGEIDDEFVVIATSIYGLPYASVVSYKLGKSLYLFSRRSDYKHDFRTMSFDNLQNEIDAGLQSVVLIDDIYDTGITNDSIIYRLESLGLCKDRIKSYVVADFSDTGKPISCINKKMINEL